MRPDGGSEWERGVNFREVPSGEESGFYFLSFHQFIFHSLSPLCLAISWDKRENGKEVHAAKDLNRENG